MSENNVDRGKHYSHGPGFNANQIHGISTRAEETGKPPIWVWFGVAGLLLVALLVIFVLPNIVSEYELPLERRVNIAELAPIQDPTIPTSAISPFEEAQRSLQRKEAQDVLAELLEHQGDLEELEVKQWAQEAYAEALEVAGLGDEYYRSQDFRLATESYGNSRDSLLAIFEKIPSVFEQTIIEGQNALASRDSALAQDKFSLALLLDPGSNAAQIGSERSRVLDEVLDLSAEAEELYEQDELAAARSAYQQVVSLDRYHETAQQKISEITALILEQEFAGVMSTGYSLLEDGDPAAAIAEFERAANMGINAEQALAAIAQAETGVANTRIAKIQEQIASAEAQEEWHAAVIEYDNALAIDSNLVFAISGRDYASKRAQLDDLLSASIESPDRFYEDDVFQQTLDIYYTGRAIESPGRRLAGQLDELQVLLETSQVPLDIRMVSDNLTDVTILRIGILGLFEETTVSLKPGRYVAVGKRIGYREVREEFVVGFGQTPESIVVQCVERVVATNR
ncbi:MAG: hypothetical protein CMQ41_10895 [Gammaproteobacteria bacterium]|nr:hypothetical protein [Gammaproteobacteria bacterium]|tara:strand:- start:53 stop:1591 length:1539 start_codon:yes stop_codon:yes gene_type:complete